jgi:hypothetical protein
LRCSRIVKRKILYAVLLVAVLAFGIRVYLAFHPSRAFVSRSPVGSRVVDCIPGSFVDLSYHFRAHDLRASPLRPVVIADLYWEQRYLSGSLTAPAAMQPTLAAFARTGCASPPPSLSLQSSGDSAHLS